MKTYLEGMKNITILEDMVTIKSTMKKTDEEKLYAAAGKITQR